MKIWRKIALLFVIITLFVFSMVAGNWIGRHVEMRTNPRLTYQQFLEITFRELVGRSPSPEEVLFYIDVIKEKNMTPQEARELIWFSE